MKAIRHTLRLLVPLLLAALPARAVIITGFGADDLGIIDFVGDSSTGQDDSSYTFTAVDNFELYGSLATPVSLTFESTLTLDLTALASSDLAGSFTLGLYDDDGDGILFTGSWADLTGGVLSTISLTYAYDDLAGDGTLDGTYTTLLLQGGGDGTSTISLTLDSLTTASPVPEPAGFPLLAGLSALTAALARRPRRDSVRASATTSAP